MISDCDSDGLQKTPWKERPGIFSWGETWQPRRGSWMIFMNRCWWLLKFIQFLRMCLNLSSCVLTIATHYLPKAISEVTLILEGHDIWAPRPTKTRNSRLVITGFVKPTWERVPWNSHESTQVSAIFFKRILMRLEASSPLCALCGLFGGRICEGWIDPMICHEVTLPPSWLADWFKGWTHPGPSNSKVYQLNIDFVGKTVLSFWVPGFFFSAMWVLGRHGRASPRNMGSKVWPTKILKNSRMARNPINYTSFKMWGYLLLYIWMSIFSNISGISG